MTRLLKDPLFHFLILGVGLFLFNGLFGNDNGAEIPEREPSGKALSSKEIAVSRGKIVSLLEKFKKVRQRPPTGQELKGLIDGYVREEVMYREALALNLDQNDPIVRRRLQQKLEFMTEDIASLTEPTEEVLKEYLAAHPDAFRLDSRCAFRQVFLNAKKRGAGLDADIQKLLSALQTEGADADIREAGDSLMLEQVFQETSQHDVAKLFGQEFARELLTLPTGSWQGPIKSAYGVHLVFVSQRIDGRLPDLEQVRGAVMRDWSAAMRKQSNEALYNTWLEGYTVTVEDLPTGQDDDSP